MLIGQIWLGKKKREIKNYLKNFGLGKKNDGIAKSELEKTIE